MEESHPLHQISLQIRESLWQAMYKLIQDERNLIERMCDAIEKDNPATAGSMGVIIDCCNEKLDELRCCANTCQIKLN